MANKNDTTYKVVINDDGTFTTDVVCRGKRACSDVVTVMQQISGLAVSSVKDKPDTVPNFNELFNNR